MKKQPINDADDEESPESNITRENNHIYFYSDIDDASIYTLEHLSSHKIIQTNIMKII